MGSRDSIDEIVASCDSNEVPSSSLCETPPIINSTKTKSKCSIRHLLSLENKHHGAASNSATTHKNDVDNDATISFCSKIISSDHHEAASSSATTHKNDDEAAKMISSDLLLMDLALKEYMDHMNVQINQARQKCQELQTLGGNQRDFNKLRKAITKLWFQMPSHRKIRSADSNPLHIRRLNINEAKDGMTHFLYEEPKPVHTGDSDGLWLWKAFHDLSRPLRYCLLCFFKFPPGETIKRSTMIYLWIGQGFISWHLSDREDFLPKSPEEDVGNKIFDELIAEGFIEPIYENYSLAPDSCRMSVSVRSSLYKDAYINGFASTNSLDLDGLYVPSGRLGGHSCQVNVGEAIINYEPEIFEKMKHIQSLHLGRWQSLATHHIELADAKILHGLKKLYGLTFLSLRGISMIMELPTVILELNDLKILDLRACHNLEVIPDNIGLLKSLTHLDMSECYFLEHMPKSLAQLSNLEVLKGFLIGDLNDNNKQSCTLYDLSRLVMLRKLNIYVSVKDFHRQWDFDDLKKLVGLQKLTISWGGCRQSQEVASTEQFRPSPLTLPPGLQKLDLQAFPIESLTDWLRPSNIKGLEKLYIRGGQLHDLGPTQIREGEGWTVEILRLKYLSDLEIDWSYMERLFPKLIYLHQVGCPKLTNFSCDESGVWMKEEAIDTHEQLQKYHRRVRTRGRMSSSSIFRT